MVRLWVQGYFACDRSLGQSCFGWGKLHILLLLYVYFSDELFKQLQSFLFFLHFSGYILVTVPISRILFCHLIFELMIVPIFHCCRYFTLLDLDCSASSRCSVSGLFRFNIQLQLSWSCCVVLVSYVFLALLCSKSTCISGAVARLQR